MNCINIGWTMLSSSVHTATAVTTTTAMNLKANYNETTLAIIQYHSVHIARAHCGRANKSKVQTKQVIVVVVFLELVISSLRHFFLAFILRTFCDKCWFGHHKMIVYK